MQRNSNSCLITLLALLFALGNLALIGCDLAVSIVVAPEILTVCPSGCDYTSIQEAIEMAGSGDIIEVGAGAYLENLIIDNSLTLLGAGSEQTVIYGAGGPTVVISSGSVHIEGFTITGGKETEEGRWDGDGISIEGSAAADIRNVVIKCNDNDGIEARDYAEVTLQESEISRNGWGLFLMAQVFHVVKLTSSSSWGWRWGRGSERPSGSTSTGWKAIPSPP